jgi:hypothetical protein
MSQHAERIEALAVDAVDERNRRKYRQFVSKAARLHDPARPLCVQPRMVGIALSLVRTQDVRM